MQSLELTHSFDELKDEAGRIREHWSFIQSGLEKLGPVGLARRWEEARRLIRDNGITYSSLGDAGASRRPWELDPIPAVLPPSDWAFLERALCQRAHLHEKMLDDLYGEQNLLRYGIIPSYLVLGNPNFLRQCAGLCLPQSSRILLSASDALRDQHGQWWVMRSRTQCPTGFGYILENRLVVARMFGELFRDSHATPLAPFYQAIRRRLGEFAEKTDSDRTVLLSPGPNSHGYFEDAYLAQYLGCPMVESGDLTVRGSQVYLKMLDGLQRVGSILRRVSDHDCDPLELQSENWAGVPGLVQAVREGNVVLANSLGSGLLETPALGGYFEKACRFLLDEDLLLPDLPSRWCGQPNQLRWVEQNFDKLLIHSAFGPRGPRHRRSWLVSSLEASERQQLFAKVQANPHEFVGQLVVMPSCFPSLSEHQLASKLGHCRFFLGAIEEEEPYRFKLLPGGLIRTSSHLPVPSSKPAPIGSKDLWYIEPTIGSYFTSHPASARPLQKPLQLTRSGGDLPSRSADNFYWLGRYLERAEFLVRATRVALRTVIEFPHMQAVESQLLRPWNCLKGGSDNDPLGLSVWSSVRGWIRDSSSPDGLVTLINRIQSLTGSLADRLSSDSLRVTHSLRTPPQIFREPSQALQYLEELAIPLWAWAGIISQSLHRGHSHRFLKIGRSLERIWQSRHLLTLVAHSGQDFSLAETQVLLEFALDVAESSRIYRRRYQTRMEQAAVLDLILADLENPRAVAYQLQQLHRCFEGLPKEVWQEGRHTAERTAMLLETQVRMFSCRSHDIEGLLSQLTSACNEITSDLSHRYLSHLQPKQQRSVTGIEEEWL